MIFVRDTGDDKTLMPYESNEDSQEYINKQIDQADKRGQRDKWLLYPTKNIHEMKASTQVSSLSLLYYICYIV
ncbi:unnamed protein product [Brassica oleracea var. botrytis]